MSVVSAPMSPLYTQGFGPAVFRTRYANLAGAPKYPLYQMGHLGDDAKIVGTVAPIAAKAGGSIAAAAGAGSWAGPIGAGVGVAVALIASLMAAHNLRKKQATNENSAMNTGVSGFDADLKTVQAAVKAGNLGPSDATQAVNVLLANYWQLVAPYIQPGRNGCNNGSSCPPPSKPGVNPCTGNIGAACCVGCFNLALSITSPDGVLAAISGQSTASGGPYVSNISKVYPSKYGGRDREAYTLDWSPPASAVSSLTSSLTSGGSSSLPLLIGAAVALWAVMR